ncbi:adenylate cyclase type 9 isoform X1 [Petromyzon marinus]|uniref:adenylate cyclase type 9 isoform X1 n=2 Tax=Petromyzon marinus TaxID=7757 RepID=UPI003F72EE90
MRDGGGTTMATLGSEVLYDTRGHGGVSVRLTRARVSSCCSGDSASRPGGRLHRRHRRHRLPQLFERAAASWWNPKFDSLELEAACEQRCYPQTRRRFRYALAYASAACLLRALTYALDWDARRAARLAPALSFLLLCAGLMALTFLRAYERRRAVREALAVLLFVALAGASLAMAAALVPARPFLPPDLSPVGSFAVCVEVLLLLYTAMPLPLYACALLGLSYSVLFEVVGQLWSTGLLLPNVSAGWLSRAHTEGLAATVVGKAFLHLCIHAIGIHIFIMSQVRSRSTFLKVGQSIIHGKELEVEKALKEKMIHAVMPRMIADELLRQQGDDDSEVSPRRCVAPGCPVAAASAAAAAANSSASAPTTASNPGPRKKKKGSIPREQLPFRPFTMKRMSEVSVLFADIVGFTKMSANKSAATLVRLLNDLFGRFDKLCEVTGCEKISTLGDCYYCVAGCPEPRTDHAACCVEMGLGMIAAIEQFCRDNRETVDMRVGVHTGTVLCGILGMKRFKFDVLSNDVNLANMMEQLGVAGKVHVSEATALCLDERYTMEDGRLFERIGPNAVLAEQLKGMKTFLISGYRDEDARPSWREGSQPVLSSSQGCLLYPWSPPWGDEPLALHAHQGGSLPSSHLLEDGQTLAAGAPAGPATPAAAAGADQNPQTEAAPATRPPRPHSDGANAHGSKASCTPSVFSSSGGDGGGGGGGGGCGGGAASKEKAVEGHNGCQDSAASKDRALGPEPPCKGPPKVHNGLLAVKEEGKLANSRTSLVETLQERMCKERAPLLPINMRYKHLLRQSDIHFVEVIKSDRLMEDYFFKPPINKLSLQFLDKNLEKAYRASYQEEVANGRHVDTFANPTFSSLLDVLLSSLVFVLASLACLLVLPPWPEVPLLPMVTFAVAFTLQLFCLLVSIRMVFFLEHVLTCTRLVMEFVSGWIPRHLIGALYVSLPAVMVLTHFTCHLDSRHTARLFFCCVMIVGVTHYLNFCQLSSWLRSSLATVVAALLLLLIYVPVCGDRPWGAGNESLPLNVSAPVVSVPLAALSAAQGGHGGNSGSVRGWELAADLLLLVLLIWFLNREFEVAYRLNYHGNVEAELHQRKIQHMKNQADLLLHNIIPGHVADQLKVQPHYSKNHEDVGVIFASIVNFSEFYEENYEGGKECYRVLHELMSDLDQLLARDHYGGIEKIKTIGATYMAASGLNVPEPRAGDAHAHLRTLFEFARDMMSIVEDFNKDMLWFNFRLRIGFNHGPLTAGVIGTTKPLYDIWGDTVNIASRMDSTGVDCRVQVSQESYHVLCDMGYQFDYRGTVNVKGKGQMKTYLFPPTDGGHAAPQPPPPPLLPPLLPMTPDIHTQVDGSIGRSPAEEEAHSLLASLSASDACIITFSESPPRGGGGGGDSPRRALAGVRGQRASSLSSLPHGAGPRGRRRGYARPPVSTAAAALAFSAPPPPAQNGVGPDARPAEKGLRTRSRTREDGDGEGGGGDTRSDLDDGGGAVKDSSRASSGVDSDEGSEEEEEEEPSPPGPCGGREGGGLVPECRPNGVECRFPAEAERAGMCVQDSV